METQGEKLRALITRKNGVAAFGIATALDAHVATMAGVETIYAGGYSNAGKDKKPDMGLLSVTDILHHARLVADATPLPVVIDIDDGYGNAINAREVMKALLKTTEIAGVHLEDQRNPKRCGHISGKDCIPLDEYLGKLQAIIDIRNKIDPSVVIISRTDSFSAAGGKKDPQLGGDIEEAVRRATAALEIGADLAWCEFPTPDDKSARAFAAKVLPKNRLAFNVSPSFSAELWEKFCDKMTDAHLNAMGYKYRFSTYPALLAAMHAVYDAALKFVKGGAVKGLIDVKRHVAGSPTEIAMKVIGVSSYLEMERKYSPSAAKMQKNSEGFK